MHIVCWSTFRVTTIIFSSNYINTSTNDMKICLAITSEPVDLFQIMKWKHKPFYENKNDFSYHRLPQECEMVLEKGNTRIVQLWLDNEAMQDSTYIFSFLPGRDQKRLREKWGSGVMCCQLLYIDGWNQVERSSMWNCWFPVFFSEINHWAVSSACLFLCKFHCNTNAFFTLLEFLLLETFLNSFSHG